MNVYHYNRDPSRAHSIPFRHVCRVDESVKEFKERLQQRLKMSEKEWMKVKVNAVAYDGTEKELAGKKHNVLICIVNY